MGFVKWVCMYAYLTFLERMALSLRARSWDLILRSRFLRAKTRFSEFLMWWVCSRFIIRSIPLDCIFLCINVSADSRFPLKTFTRIPLHCSWRWWCPWLTESTPWLDRLKTFHTLRAAEFIAWVCLFSRDMDGWQGWLFKWVGGPAAAATQMQQLQEVLE